jgi:hypothetical protein
LAAPSDDGQTTAPAGAPALPATPRPRLLLALRRAAAGRDETTIAAVIEAGRREEPDWDPNEELARLGAAGDAGGAGPASPAGSPGSLT